MAAPRRHDMSVHMERNEELPLKLRLSFTNMPCSLINVDVVDEGESYAHGELWSELHKVPLDASGAEIPGSRERVDLTRDREFKEGLALHTAQHRRGLLGEKEGPREGGDTGGGAEGGAGVGAEVVDRGNADPADVDGHIPDGEDGPKEVESEKATSEARAENDAKSMKEEMMKDMESLVDELARKHGTPSFGDRKASLERGEGCLVYGEAHLKRLAGRIQFHMAAMQWYYMEELMFSGMGSKSQLNMSHHIEHLGFGEPVPGAVNPLDGHTKVASSKEGTYQYYLNTVPTEYRWRSGKKMLTHQYSVNELALPLADHVQPQVVFKYDVSPIQVTITEQSLGFGHFLVRVCAVIGGVFAVTGMIDTWVFRLIGLLEGAGDKGSLDAAARRIL